MAIDAVSAHAPANAIARFEHEAGAAASVQGLRTRDPREPATDHRRIDPAHASTFLPRVGLDRHPERLGAFAAVPDSGFNRRTAQIVTAGKALEGLLGPDPASGTP
jgi:hypothetical protein